MKKLMAIVFVILAFLFINYDMDSTGGKKLPAVKVKNLKGKLVNTQNFNNDGKPFIISIWATWCKPCILELNSINDVYEDWQEETGVKVIAVSIDDSRASKKVAPYVKGKGWEFEVYLDVNGDFKRAMNVNNPPHTFLMDGEGNIVWEHNGYASGDEEELYKKVKELIK